MTTNTFVQMDRTYKLTPRFDHELAQWLARAQSGKDPHAALSVIVRFVNAVEAGEPPAPALLGHIAKAFREMLDSGTRDPRRPFGLLRKKAGNPGGTPNKRLLTRDTKAELQDLVWKLYAAGKSQGEIVRHLSKIEITPAIPARHPGQDTIRDMVRVVTQQLPRRRDELRSSGAMDYDIPDRLAREFDVDRGVIDRALLRLMTTSDSIDWNRNN